MLIWAIWAFGRYFIKASQSNITFGYSHWNVSIDVETIALIETIEITARTFRINNKQQEHSLIEALKIACRKFSKERTGKKPFTNINLVRI